MVRGEQILAALFGLLGAAWVAGAFGYSYWSGFAPGSGFFPAWIGAVLLVLVGVFLFTSWRAAPAAVPSAPPAFGRMAAIIAGLVACVALLEWTGFVVAVTAYIAFLLRVVERQGAAITIGVSLGTSLSIFLIFRTWLGVPLPLGPWGF